MLDSGAIDIGMLEIEESRQAGIAWKLAEMKRSCVCHARIRLRPKSAWRRRIWTGWRWSCSISSFLQRRVLDQLCKKAGVHFRLVLQSNFVPVIHQAVADGLGASTLLRKMVEQDLRLVPLSFNPPEIFHFSLCWRHALSKANETFVHVALGRYRWAPKSPLRKS